jgi:hypothetical protein
MKRRLITLIALVALTAVPAFAQRKAGQNPPPPSSFNLTINVNTRFAAITVDGALIKGNVAVVSSGNHTVQVNARGFKNYSTTVTVNADYVLNVNLEPDFLMLTVNVNVPAFAFYLDNRPVKGNSTPVTPGSHQVKVLAQGYAPYETTVNVDQSMTVDVNLQQDLLDLTVLVNVKFAQISIDGALIKGNVAKVAPGAHTVKVSAMGFAIYEMNVNVNQSMALNVNLQQDLVNLTVLVNVKGAQIFVDGAQIMGWVAKIAPGAHQLKVLAPGFAPYEASVNVNQSMSVNVNLQQDLLDLTILVNVKGAQIWVDNQALKGNVARIAPGSHQIQVQAPGYQAYLQTVQVNQSMSLNVNLQQTSFNLNVSCDVKFAQIFINDAEQRFFPVQLPAGKYTVKARAKGYSDYSEDITINGDYSMQIQMRQRMGGIVVNVPDNKPGRDAKDPRGGRFGNVDVFIDNQPVKLSNGRTDVAPGGHRVKVVYDSFVAEVDVMVQPDTDYTVEPYLQLKVTAGR